MIASASAPDGWAWASAHASSSPTGRCTAAFSHTPTASRRRGKVPAPAATGQRAGTRPAHRGPRPRAHATAAPARKTGTRARGAEGARGSAIAPRNSRKTAATASAPRPAHGRVSAPGEIHQPYPYIPPRRRSYRRGEVVRDGREGPRQRERQREGGSPQPTSPYAVIGSGAVLKWLSFQTLPSVQTPLVEQIAD